MASPGSTILGSVACAGISDLHADQLNRLGRSGVSVTALGLGGAPFGNMYAALPEAQVEAAIDTAWQAGLRYFDTAPLYGHGLSEHRMGHALRDKRRDDFIYSTKVGWMLRPTDPATLDAGIFKQTLPFARETDYSYDGVMRSFEDSLQRLGTHRIDVLLIHDVDIWTHGSHDAWQQRLREVADGAYKAVARLRDEGVVKAIGAGVNESDACMALTEIGDFDAFLLAGRYTLLEQDALDDLLPRCAERGIGIVIGGPYNTGVLATGAVDGAYYNYQPAPPEILTRVRAIEAVCARHEVTLASAALQFPLAHPVVASVIPGAVSADEVARNVATIGAPIPADLWAEFKAEGLLRADAPTPG